MHLVVPVAQEDVETGASPPVVALESVSVPAGAGAALRGVSLGVSAGRVVALIGPPGSGAATVLDCAAGLLRPASGEVWWGGTEVTSLDDARLTALRGEHVHLLPVGVGAEAAEHLAARTAPGGRPRAVLAVEPGGGALLPLRAAAHRAGNAVLLATSDPVVAAAADVVVLLGGGRVVDVITGGPPSAVAACLRDVRATGAVIDAVEPDECAE
jgi:putative ABC transport system ATP-binding protein